MRTTEEKEEQILEQKYKWMDLNIIWWVWGLWCSFTTIAINHPYMGFIGTSNCGSGLDLLGGHFSSSHLGECDFKKLPKEKGNKIKKQANLTTGMMGKPSLITTFIIRGLRAHEDRRQLAYSLC